MAWTEPKRFRVGEIIRAGDLDTIADNLETLRHEQDVARREQEQPTGVLAAVAAGVVLAGSATKLTTRRKWITFGFSKR